MIADAQIPLALGYRPAMGQEDFLVAPCNEEAVAWIDSWPDWPAAALCIYGPAGCGKTHLAQVWRARSEALMPTRGSLRQQPPDRLLGDRNVCVIDDAEVDRDEGALLHLFNVISERRGHLLVTSKEPPARWGCRLDDLRSRLAAAPAVAIGSPDDGLMGAVMIKLFADRQLEVGQDAIIYALMRIERSFEMARRVVDEIDRASLSARRKVTVRLVRDVLESLGMV